MDKIQAFIFDMDGTIVETNQDICDAVNYSLKYHQLQEISYDECKGYLGNGSVKLIHRAMHFQHDEMFQSVFDVYYDYYLKNFVNKTKPYDGIVSSLEYAKQKGIKLFVYTNKPEKIASVIVNHLFGNDFFTKLVGIPLGGEVKPSVISFLNATKEFNLDYSKVYYFGDSTTDIETAYNLHVKKMISVLWGYQSKKILLSYSKKPDLLLENPFEIKKLIDNQ